MNWIKNLEKMKKIEDKEGIHTEGSVISIDTEVWMRPVTACEYLRKRGAKVSRQTITYWKNEDKVDYINLDCLGGLTLININTIPEELRFSTKGRISQ